MSLHCGAISKQFFATYGSSVSKCGHMWTVFWQLQVVKKICDKVSKVLCNIMHTFDLFSFFVTLQLQNVLHVIGMLFDWSTQNKLVVKWKNTNKIH